MIAKSNSVYGKRIWANVAKVAEGVPQWMRDRISRAARQSAENIRKDA